MSILIEVPHRGLTLKIRRENTAVNGKPYPTFVVHDYTSGKLVRHKRSSLEDAKRKAREVADAMITGRREILGWSDRVRTEILRAMELVHPRGLGILQAATILDAALGTGVRPDEVALACKYWREHNNRPLTPKRTDEAVSEFLDSQKKRISERRFKTNSCYLGVFREAFRTRNLHEIRSDEIDELAEDKGWSKRTRNDFLGTISLFYKKAIRKGWAAENAASSEAIERERINGSHIGVFAPSQVKQMLSGIEEELKPALALWFFSGCRAAEIARLNWEQVNAGLASGKIYLRSDQTKTGQDRAVPVCDNLRAWLTHYGQASGPLMPAKWRSIDGLGEIARHVARRCKVQWEPNGPRHSYASYSLALGLSPREVKKAMGNSLRMLDRHYDSRSACVTKECATEYFGIMPDRLENVIAMPASEQPQEEPATVRVG